MLPPTAFYLSMDDTLLAQFLTSGTGLTFTITVRMLLADGTLKVDNYQSFPSVFNPQIYYCIIPPVEGYVLSSMLQGGGTLDGSCFATLIVYRGTITPPIAVFPPVAGMVLIQGYLDSWTYLSWPQSPLIEAGEGAGRMRNMMLTPAAGTNWTLKPTSAQRWEVQTVQFAFNTSAAAGNRQVSLLLFDRLGNAVVRIPANFTQAASLGYSYYFYNTAAHLQTAATWITAPFPLGINLENGMSLQSSVAGLQAGDSWASVSILVTEWMGVGHS